MLKFISKSLFQGLAAVFAVVAMTNIGTTSMFLMYQPEPPKSLKSRKNYFDSKAIGYDSRM